jgi:Arc/MetJ family transcription regulator
VVIVCYDWFMRRTSLEIDDALLSRAQRVLGTTGVKDTVDRALQEVLQADLRRRLADRVRSGKGVDRGEDVLAASRKWRR